MTLFSIVNEDNYTNKSSHHEWACLILSHLRRWMPRLLPRPSWRTWYDADRDLRTTPELRLSDGWAPGPRPVSGSRGLPGLPEEPSGLLPKATRVFCGVPRRGMASRRHGANIAIVISDIIPLWKVLELQPDTSCPSSPLFLLSTH